jgi:urea transport system ATP-binding protein
MNTTELIAGYREFSPRINRIGARDFLLFVEDLTAVFDGFKAVDIEAWGVKRNELRVVIGPNGAGKTTLCDLVSGKTRPTTGTVFFEGADITHALEADIALRGIGRKFQTPRVYDSLTTFENMELALPGSRKVRKFFSRSVSKDEQGKILQILERVRLKDDRHTEAKRLSHGQRQWLAISMLILSSPKLLLVDEPAAGLTDIETELTAELLLELKDEHTIIVIEHDMDFVRQLDSKVTVLNEGRILAEGDINELTANEEVIEAYLGR